jgi:peptidyl-prolyl cis-trans isomerase A (cyclophilin A)
MRDCGILLSVAACVMLAACSSPTNESKEEPPKKEEPKAAIPEKAPDVFKVDFDTSKGMVVVEVHRDWAPLGVDHFYTLVKLGFYDGDRFFRYVRGFIVQFGVSGDPKANRTWANANIQDDPVIRHNVRGTLVYATAGPNTRTTQLFFNLANNSRLDAQGFAPFATVVTGMDVVDSFYSGYGEMPPQGEGPDSSKIEVQGNDYLLSHFPRLDYIKKATME